MGRACADCQHWREDYEFSTNQWRKGSGGSRCSDCVAQTQQPVTCEVCCRSLPSDNALQQHMQTHSDVWCGQCDRVFCNANARQQHAQVHQPRNVACPLCHETRFRSSTNAVQHIEGGACTACRGQDNARAAIYGFVRQNAGHLLTSTPMLEYHRDAHEVPDLPYQCQQCDRSFRQMSAMMQHQAARHSAGAPALGWAY